MSKKKKNNEKACCCLWTNCKEFTLQLNGGLTKADDVWQGKPICLRVGGNWDARTEALRAAVHYHVLKGKGGNLPKKLYIARHHWPRVLLEFNRARKIKQLCVPLSTLQTKHVARKDISDRLIEKCNKVKTLLKDDQHNDEIYVQAPVSTTLEVQQFIDEQQSDRSSRVAKRAAYAAPTPECPSPIHSPPRVAKRAAYVTPAPPSRKKQMIERKTLPRVAKRAASVTPTPPQERSKG
jgi:hypothetical protein